MVDAGRDTLRRYICLLHEVSNLAPKRIGGSKIVLFDLIVQHYDLGEQEIFIKELPKLK